MKKSNTLLKVCSILMMIGGILGIITGIIAIIGVAALLEMMEGQALAGTAALLYGASILAVAGSVIQTIAAAKGLGACKAPEKAQSCVIWGIIVAALCVVAQILNVVGGSGFDAVSLVTGLVLPVLYIVGANQIKTTD